MPDGITCPGKCRSQSILRCERCLPKNSGIVFARRSLVCETELLHVKRQTIASSSVLLIYLDSPVPRSSLTWRRRAERVFALLTTFRLIFLISGDINGILWKKCLLLRINKAISHFFTVERFRTFRNLNLLGYISSVSVRHV